MLATRQYPRHSVEQLTWLGVRYFPSSAKSVRFSSTRSSEWLTGTSALGNAHSTRQYSVFFFLSMYDELRARLLMPGASRVNATPRLAACSANNCTAIGKRASQSAGMSGLIAPDNPAAVCCLSFTPLRFLLAVKRFAFAFSWLRDLAALFVERDTSSKKKKSARNSQHHDDREMQA
jgi:hypothetical protein